MAKYVSPGVYVIEKDLADYVPSLNSSFIGVTGFASKGPINTPTLITNQASLVATFGEPSENIQGQALEGSLEILEQTNGIYFNRAADTSALDASAKISLARPAVVGVSGNGYGVTKDLYLDVTVSVSGLGSVFTKQYAIPQGTNTTQGAALRAVLSNGEKASDEVAALWDFDSSFGETSGFISTCRAGSGVTLTVNAFSANTYAAADGINVIIPLNASGDGTGYGMTDSNNLAGISSSVTAYGGEFETSGTYYLVESLYPGAGYNGGLKSDGTLSGNQIEVSPFGLKTSILEVLTNGATEESYQVSLRLTKFIQGIINTGEDNTVSKIIKGNLYINNNIFENLELTSNLFIEKFGTIFTGISTAGLSFKTGDGDTIQNSACSNLRFIKLKPTKTATSDVVNLAGGTNGDSSLTSILGSNATEPKTGVYAFEDDSLNIAATLVPGIQSDQTIQNALVSVAETTQSHIALLAPPYAVGNTSKAIDWHNGIGNLGRTSPINSSYAAIFWPWLKVFSQFDGKDRWYDPTIFAARQIAFNDSVADPWFAPAGFVRGRLTKPSDIEVKLNQGDRDALYSGGNAINPIVSFPQQGITIFGQRTAQREPTALDRINVRRLVIYIRRVILKSAARFVFEPNDEFTWTQVEELLNPFMDDLKQRRGITEFKVVCDETVNTPARVDRNELWCKVIFRPTKTAEIIVFELNLTSQSSNIEQI